MAKSVTFAKARKAVDLTALLRERTLLLELEPVMLQREIAAHNQQQWSEANVSFFWFVPGLVMGWPT